MTSAPDILLRMLPQPLRREEGLAESRPHVTLTYAQSLDAKIAGVGGKQLILSGAESMLMTHWMRTMHDAILVGIGTALNDNPQLNTRHVPNSAALPAPRPVILDANLRLPVACKLLANYTARTGRRPWIFCADDADTDGTRRDALETAGAVVIPIGRGQDGQLHIPALLKELCSRGILSLMVEGGQRVISSFMAARQVEDDQPVVDVVIVTVAPTLVGADGIGVALEGAQVFNLNHLASQVMGKDVVIACRVAGV